MIHWFFLNSSKQESFTESVTKRVRDMEGRERVWDRWAVLEGGLGLSKGPELKKS